MTLELSLLRVALVAATTAVLGEAATVFAQSPWAFLSWLPHP